MIKFAFLAILCFLTTIASAQLHISTNLRMDFSWDEINDDWTFESQDDQSLTFFEFNKEYTIVKHTTSTATSAYIIKSFEHVDEEGREQYNYMIVSDLGNKYLMVLDIKNTNIRFVSNDGSHLVKYRIKSSWADD